GLAPPSALPRRGPGALLPHREHGSGDRAAGAGQGRLPPMPGDRRVPELGSRVRSGRRHLGRDGRGRASGPQASRRARRSRPNGL
ncbi:MAG: WhiB-like transcription regulator, partial [uncultured Corynebacteriales bacterium]